MARAKNAVHEFGLQAQLGLFEIAEPASTEPSGRRGKGAAATSSTKLRSLHAVRDGRAALPRL